MFCSVCVCQLERTQQQLEREEEERERAEQSARHTSHQLAALAALRETSSRDKVGPNTHAQHTHTHTHTHTHNTHTD